ncbi:MAG: LysE family translocator [Ignavibacteriaceae bacterium]|nr:LysE family translocator [Ignavibacteriaceae bacterium]
MDELTSLFAFISACIVIILIPGPAQALVLSNSISYGKKSGIITAIGLNAATIFHSLFAAAGLSAILHTSAVLFSIVKFLGAGYLIFIGFMTLKNSSQKETAQNNSSLKKVFLKAFITGILNPKVALFFLAFLPQFVDVSRGNVFFQFILLGTILALMDIGYETLLVLITSFASDRFVRNEKFIRVRQKITGTVLIILGIRLAFAQNK